MRSSKEGNGVLCSSCLLASRGEKLRGGQLCSSSQHLDRGRRPPPPAAQRICARGSAPTASALHPWTCPSARREIWDFAIVKVGFAVLPSNNWASPNCHYETMPHLCNAFSIFYNSFFVLLFYLLCELTLIHLPETYPFLVTSTAVSSHSFLPSLLAPLLSSAPMAAVAVNTP